MAPRRLSVVLVCLLATAVILASIAPVDGWRRRRRRRRRRGWGKKLVKKVKKRVKKVGKKVKKVARKIKKVAKSIKEVVKIAIEPFVHIAKAGFQGITGLGFKKESKANKRLIACMTRGTKQPVTGLVMQFRAEKRVERYFTGWALIRSRKGAMTPIESRGAQWMMSHSAALYDVRTVGNGWCQVRACGEYLKPCKKRSKKTGRCKTHVSKRGPRRLQNVGLVRCGYLGKPTKKPAACPLRPRSIGHRRWCKGKAKMFGGHKMVLCKRNMRPGTEELSGCGNNEDCMNWYHSRVYCLYKNDKGDRMGCEYRQYSMFKCSRIVKQKAKLDCMRRTEKGLWKKFAKKQRKKARIQGLFKIALMAVNPVIALAITAFDVAKMVVKKDWIGLAKTALNLVLPLPIDLILAAAKGDWKTVREGAFMFMAGKAVGAAATSIRARFTKPPPPRVVMRTKLGPQKFTTKQVRVGDTFRLETKSVKQFYKVKPGDTLGGIQQKFIGYGTGSVVFKLNSPPLTNKNMVPAGMMLELPIRKQVVVKVPVQQFKTVRVPLARVPIRAPVVLPAVQVKVVPVAGNLINAAVGQNIRRQQAITQATGNPLTTNGRGRIVPVPVAAVPPPNTSHYYERDALALGFTAAQLKVVAATVDSQRCAGSGKPHAPKHLSARQRMTVAKILSKDKRKIQDHVLRDTYIPKKAVVIKPNRLPPVKQTKHVKRVVARVYKARKDKKNVKLWWKKASRKHKFRRYVDIEYREAQRHAYAATVGKRVRHTRHVTVLSNSRVKRKYYARTICRGNCLRKKSIRKCRTTTKCWKSRGRRKCRSHRKCGLSYYSKRCYGPCYKKVSLRIMRKTMKKRTKKEKKRARSCFQQCKDRRMSKNVCKKLAKKRCRWNMPCRTRTYKRCRKDGDCRRACRPRRSIIYGRSSCHPMCRHQNARECNILKNGVCDDKDPKARKACKDAVYTQCRKSFVCPIVCGKKGRRLGRLHRIREGEVRRRERSEESPRRREEKPRRKERRKEERRSKVVRRKRKVVRKVVGRKRRRVRRRRRHGRSFYWRRYARDLRTRRCTATHHGVRVRVHVHTTIHGHHTRRRRSIIRRWHNRRNRAWRRRRNVRRWRRAKRASRRRRRRRLALSRRRTRRARWHRARRNRLRAKRRRAARRRARRRRRRERRMDR